MEAPGKPREVPLYRYRFGTAEFDEASFELRVSGLAVDLERKPLEILQQLLRHAGEVVTREELFDTVWAGRITVDNVLANAVAKLRKGLGEANAESILTQPRIGYRFTGTLERIAVGRKPVSSLSLTAGMRVPRREHFQLEVQLGSSHSSEVWLAHHVKTGEPRVYKFSIDGERLSSLKREATLSRLLRDGLGERDDFARVIDWNFEEPPFFLECEFGGQNLIEWADTTAGLKSLDTGWRLQLFLKVADAVAAAHSLGVLHKDLKPANVLVQVEADGGLVVRLTDFGASRLLEPGRLAELGITQLGLTMTQGIGGDSTSGTPLYIAPEVIQGQAPTIQSDVYALGIMLYQIIAGDLKKPMVSSWEQDIDDELLREDIGRATDGNPARRLPSVNELIERLRSVDARRQERRSVRDAELRAQLAERLVERARARRPWVLMAGGVLVLGLVASSALFVRAERQREVAVQAQAEAQQQAARAQAINRFLNEDVLGGAVTGEGAMVPDTTIRQALNNAEKELDKRLGNYPVVAASIRLTMAKLFSRMADMQRAESQAMAALDLMQRKGPPNDPMLVRCRYELALIQRGPSIGRPNSI